MNKDKISRIGTRRIPSLATFLFVLFILLLFNFSNWRTLRRLEDSKRLDLEKRLRSVAMVIVQSLQSPSPPYILGMLEGQSTEEQSQKLDDYSETSFYQELLSRLARLQGTSGLAELSLLTPEGLVVADASRRSSAGDPFLYSIDQVQIKEAAKGIPSVRPLYRNPGDGQYYQRIYVPVLSPENKVQGILQASVSPDFLEEMADLKRKVLRDWILTSLLLCLLGISLYRVFKYLVRVEHTAMQVARVEAMGALAGGLAHELRNPLAIIRVLSEEITTEVPRDSRAAENARDIITETKRLGDLVNHFLSLSRAPRPETMENVDLRAELERVVVLMRKGAPESLRFELSLPRDPVIVLGDERALRQVLLNLILNAREALPEKGGQVTVELHTKRHRAEITIADNGEGIPRKHLARIFEPFYTTKSAGTGLGLAICKSIIENLGGTISIQSSEGKGTRVHLTLPLPDTGSHSSRSALPPVRQ